MGTRCLRGRSGQRLEPRIGDPIREQQVGGEPVLRWRPARPRPRRSDARGGRDCRSAPRPRVARRVRPAIPDRPVRGWRRARTLRAAALLDGSAGRAPRSALVSSTPSLVPARPRSLPRRAPRPATPREGRRRCRLTASMFETTDATSAASRWRGPATAEQDEIERAIDVDPQSTTGPQIRDRHAGLLLEPARQHVVGREIGNGREDGTGMGDRDDIGGIAVVGACRRPGPAGRRHELPAIGRGSRAGSRPTRGR